MIDIEKIGWRNYELKITCRGCSESLELNDITEFQGELKKRTQSDIDKVIASIYKYGFSFPFFIWLKLDDAGIPESNYCLDGHGRIQALRYLRDKKGVSIPSLPVVYIDAKDEEEAKQKLLRLNSQYGIMTVESVLEFAGDIELDRSEISLMSSEINLDYDSAEYSGSEEERKPKMESDFVYKEQFGVIVMCKSESDQINVYNRLHDEGFEVRVVKV